MYTADPNAIHHRNYGGSSGQIQITRVCSEGVGGEPPWTHAHKFIVCPSEISCTISALFFHFHWTTFYRVSICVYVYYYYCCRTVFSLRVWMYLYVFRIVSSPSLCVSESPPFETNTSFSTTKNIRFTDRIASDHHYLLYLRWNLDREKSCGNLSRARDGILSSPVTNWTSAGNLSQRNAFIESQLTIWFRASSDRFYCNIIIV